MPLALTSHGCRKNCVRPRQSQLQNATSSVATAFLIISTSIKAAQNSIVPDSPDVHEKRLSHRWRRVLGCFSSICYHFLETYSTPARSCLVTVSDALPARTRSEMAAVKNHNTW